MARPRAVHPAAHGDDVLGGQEEHVARGDQDVTLKRKQQDSGGAMAKIASAMKEPEMRVAAKEFERSQRESSRMLAKSIADFAVKIATQAPTSA